MPFEVNILVQLSAIPTREAASELSNKVFGLIHETICDSDIPDDDLVVSNTGIVEYDERGDTVPDIVHLPSEETQQKIRDGIDQARRGETKDLGSFTQYLDDEEDTEPAHCESGPSMRSKCGNPADYDVWISRPDGATGITLRHCADCADWLASRFQGDPTRTVHRTPIAKDTP